jgi:hypothetical protein
LPQTVNSLFGWYYPETVHKFYVINAPLLFRTAWSMIRPLVHPITAAKFNILGQDWLKKVTIPLCPPLSYPTHPPLSHSHPITTAMFHILGPD